VTRIEVNGLSLNVEVAGDGPALLLLHGFTGSTATWRPLLGHWTAFRSIAVDLIGHGSSDSPLDPERYRMRRCVEDLAALLDRLAIDRAAVLGYSMGGRVALHFALSAPARLSALVLESASPGIGDPAEREARVRSDEALAGDIERKGVAAFVTEWEQLPLFATQRSLSPEVREGLRQQRLRNRAVGLANSLRGMGAGAQEYLLPRLSEVRVPVLVLAGALDAKYCALAREMASLLPHARVEIVPAAGHAIHLEQPDAFARAVRAFLAGHLRGEG